MWITPTASPWPAARCQPSYPAACSSCRMATTRAGTRTSSSTAGKTSRERAWWSTPSVAGAAPGVGERSSGDGDELPGVRARAQRELQHPERRAVGRLASRQRRAHAAVAASPGPHHELTDSSRRIGGPRWRLLGEALVVVVVSRDGDFGPIVVQRLPQGLRLAVAAVLRAAAEPRFVPIGQRALLGVGRQVGTQPRLLRRAGAHVHLAVQRNDVPVAQIVAVVAPSRRPRGVAEVGEVARGAGGVVV